MEVTPDQDNNLFQLIAVRGGRTGAATVLTTGRYLLGRTESCDVIVPAKIVSSVHAVLEVSTKAIKVYDMNSRNGTYINGEKIIAADLKVNDKISFGNVEFTLKKYSAAPELPPVLETLDPIKGEASVVKKKLPKKSPVEIPNDRVAYDKGDDIPYIVYPLSSDPNSDFSEYIFEDEDELYPIFKYELNKQSLEVIILHKDKVYSVDYLPSKDKKYQISGLKKRKQDIEFPYLAKEEKVTFIEVHKGNCLVNQLHNYELLHLTDNQVKASTSGQVNLQANDIVKLQNGDLEIYVRRVASPPIVKTPPFFRRDKDLRKYLMIMLLLVLVPVIALNLIEVEDKLKDEKDPERIATILYKQKLTLNKNKAVEKTKKQKPKKQTAKKKPAMKKEPTKTQSTQQKSVVKKKVVKDPGTKTAKKVVKVKKAKTPAPKNKNIIKKGQTKSVRKAQKVSRAQQRRANVTKKSPGRVDTYKSFDFKSSINTLMAKGGSLRGAKTAKTTASSISSTSVGGGVGSVATANVSSDPGSLVGATEGKISRTKGTKGLSTKSGTYTAGIPSETVVLGSMDPDVIRRILRDNIPRFRSCYQRELDRNSNKDISGMIRMVFTIGASGYVARAGVDGNSRLPARVKGCVINVLKGIEFPRPMGGGTVDVKQPFNFYPKRI